VTGAVLLIGLGGMLVLFGVVAVISALLGVGWGTNGGARRGLGRGSLRGAGGRQPVWAFAVVVGLVTLLLTGWFAAGIGAAGAVVLVPSIWSSPGAEEHIVRLEAVGSWTRRLADLLASGAASSLEAALVKSAAVAPHLMAAQVRLLVSRIEPQGARSALLAFARDMADPISDEVVMALILQLRHGGRGLAQVLTGVAGSVEDQIRMRREVESDRAKYRSNARTIVGLFATMSGGMLLFARAFLAPYGTTVGQVALFGVVGVFGASLLWMRAMIRQTSGQRLLVTADLEAGSGREAASAPGWS
jgi:tight adherence protein B